MNKVIIFDLDGTLYQTHLGLLSAVNRAYTELGLTSPSEQDVLNLIGETSENFFAKLIKPNNQAIKRELADKISHYEKLYAKKQGRLYDKTLETLVELKNNNYQLALCTNGSESYVANILATYDLGKYFSFVKHKDPVKNKAQHVKDIVTESKAGLVVMVGDSDHDIAAARVNKVVSIGARYGYRQHTISGADYFIEDITEIVSLVYQLEILCEVENRISFKNKKAYVIGINGVDTSGKSVLARALNKYLVNRGHKVQLISIDEFHNPSSIRYSGANPIDSYIDFAFNLELLKTEILLPISKGEKVVKELRLLDLNTDEFNIRKSLDIDSQTVVIIEGVLLYREPIDEFFDTRVYLDISFDEVLSRARIRDVPKYGTAFLQRYRSKYIPIQKKYLSKYQPQSKSHIVVDNNNYNKPEIIRS